jgi:hypothetical protein
MSRPARRILVAWLLALYGSVSLCGIGLHALADAIASHHNHASGHCDEGTAPSISAVNGHCPLCEFQAQGQMPVAPPGLISRPHDQPHLAIVLALIATRDRHPSCCPRAPPAPSASLV